MVEISKLILIAGIGGARMDFTAGWLGKLPNFIDNHWTLDVSTGVSQGFQGFTKILDHGTHPLESILDNFKFKLTPKAQLMCAGSFHAHNKENFKTLANSNLVEILTIDTSTADHTTVQWEFYVKTFLTQRKSYGEYLENNTWLVDQQLPNTDVTQTQRAEEIHKQLTSATKKTQVAFKFYHDIPHKTIEYNELFCNGGSKRLANILGLEVDQRYHQFWDAMLPYASSPIELTTLGRTWKKSDYFTE